MIKYVAKNYGNLRCLYKYNKPKRTFIMICACIIALLPTFVLIILLETALHCDNELRFCIYLFHIIYLYHQLILYQSRMDN